TTPPTSHWRSGWTSAWSRSTPRSPRPPPATGALSACDTGVSGSSIRGGACPAPQTHKRADRDCISTLVLAERAVSEQRPPEAPPFSRKGHERHDRERQRQREPRDREPDQRGAPTEDEPRLVAEPARPDRPAPQLAPVRPDGRGLRLRQGVRDARPRRAAGRPDRADEHVAGLVAL